MISMQLRANDVITVFSIANVFITHILFIFFKKQWPQIILNFLQNSSVSSPPSPPLSLVASHLLSSAQVSRRRDGLGMFLTKPW